MPRNASRWCRARAARISRCFGSEPGSGVADDPREGNGGTARDGMLASERLQNERLQMMRYRDAGVDVSRSDAIKDEILREIRSTWGAATVPLVGGFAGVIHVPGAPGLLAATMDGVGTKLHLAKQAGRLDDAAADLVYHGAN